MDKGKVWGLSLLLPAVLAAVTGCGRTDGTDTAEAEVLVIREARVTLTSSSAAAYFTVVNPGRESDRLLRVESPLAGLAETHESVEEDGMVRMVARPEGFEVPAGGTLELAPGGKHVMLLEPQSPGPGAQTVGLTLHFERAGTIEVEAVLEAVGGTDHEGHEGMDHGGHDDHGGHSMDHEHDHDTGS